MSRWLTEGRILGESLRRFTCIVVAGRDEAATADVALGIAEAQSAHRRVVLGDLFGDAERFAPMRADDDPHGLVDAFDYGISLARIVRPVAGTERLEFAPTGADAPDYEALLGHPRWQRLIGEFGESGDLLIIALPIDAPRLEELVYRADGSILVDSLMPARLEASRVIATVKLAPLLLAAPAPVAQLPAPPPRASAATPRVIVTPPPASARPSARQSATRASVAPAVADSTPSEVPTRSTRQSRLSSVVGRATRQTGVFVALGRPAGLGAGLSILGALLIFWLANRPFAEGRRNPVPGALPATVLKTVGGGGSPLKTTPDGNVADPADSGAAVYAVSIISANTQAGAILRLQEEGQSLPAATYRPVERRGGIWYEVLAGAFTTRGGADSLLAALRANGQLDSLTGGVVVRVPYAVLVDSMPVSAMPDALTNIRIGRHPSAYGLDQGNGLVWVMVGAFETRSQADSYAEKLRAAGYSAESVLRQGRTF